MLAVALAIVSSPAYGVSDFLGGLRSRSVALLPVLLLSQGTALILLSVIVVLLGAGPPVGVFLAYAAIAGFPAPVQGAGIVLAISGIVLISWKRNSGDSVTPGVAPSIGLGLLAALGFGGFVVAMDAASEGRVPWALLVARLTVVTVIVLSAVLRRRCLAWWRSPLHNARNYGKETHNECS